MNKEQFIQEFYLRYAGNYQKDSSCIDRAASVWQAINDKVNQDRKDRRNGPEHPDKAFYNGG